jgi:hypothetical protein
MKARRGRAREDPDFQPQASSVSSTPGGEPLSLGENYPFTRATEVSGT